MHPFEKLRRENLNIQPKIKCKCGWRNNKPTKKNEDKARCRKCGKLINERARFKETLKKKIERS